MPDVVVDGDRGQAGDTDAVLHCARLFLGEPAPQQDAVDAIDLPPACAGR